MADRASLKRKLENLEQEHRKVKHVLDALDMVQQGHRNLEMQRYIQSRSACVAKFSKSDSSKFTLKNGMVAYIDTERCDEIELHDGLTELGTFSARWGAQLNVSGISHWDSVAKRMTRIIEVLHDLKHLVCTVFPAWLKASKELDVESLVMSRTLRWISKQIGGQWPDIITGNFPI
jgi:hypothetical protein